MMNRLDFDMNMEKYLEDRQLEFKYDRYIRNVSNHHADESLYEDYLKENEIEEENEELY